MNNPEQYAAAMYNRGLELYGEGKYDQAEQCYFSTMSIVPEYFNSICFDICLSKLHQGDMSGFNLYYGRYIRDDLTSCKFPPLPISRCFQNIDQLRDKKVLVLNEQGFGDEIMFAQALAVLSDICKTATVQTYKETIQLFEEYCQYDNIEYFEARSLSFEFVEQFDAWVPFGDLFAMVAGRNELQPLNVWTDSDQNNIGFCLEGNPKSPNYEQRKIEIEHLLKVVDLTKPLINLNIDVEYEQFPSLTSGNFAITANFLCNRTSHVYATDTAIVPLCILLGVPVTLLYKSFLDWKYKTIFKGSPTLEIKSVISTEIQ